MKWIVHKIQPEKKARLAASLGISPVTAGMLIRRGAHTPELADRFLNPSLRHLPDPFTLPDMDRAVERLIPALASGEQITVYGDYDADGVTASALLTTALKSLGGRVNTYIPHRTEEGYGLNTKAVRNLAESGTRLIVTVDCGVSDHEAIAGARGLGIDVIVTDHHQLPPQIPDALAVINPQRKDSLFPQKTLAGVGVAFFLAGGLRQAMRRKGIITKNGQPELAPLLALVAIGTVADVMPLTGVNRILVSQGLHHLLKPCQPGLCALKQVGSIAEGAPVTAWDLGFRIAPRLNAPGRLDSAQPCLNLLLTDDPAIARECAAMLEQINNERRRKQNETYQQAEDMIEELDIDRCKSVVLAREGWARGIVGLAASRLAEKYRKPVLLLAVENGLALGSGRSVKGFNLFAALDQCRDLMIRFGGHEQAAGLTLKSDMVEELAAVFEEIAAQNIDEANLEPILEIEAEVDIAELTGDLGRDIDRLAPFGQGNPEPVFVLNDVRVYSASTVGSDGAHLRLTVGENGRTLDLIGFGLGALLPELGRNVSVAVQRHLSVFRGRLNESWKITDVKRSGQ